MESVATGVGWQPIRRPLSLSFRKYGEIYSSSQGKNKNEKEIGSTWHTRVWVGELVIPYFESASYLEEDVSHGFTFSEREEKEST